MMASTQRAALESFAAYCRATTAHAGADEPQNYTAFHSQTEPRIPLAEYVRRIESYCGAGEEAVLLSVVLIGRWARATGKQPSVLSMHRLFIVALRVVTKVQHDSFRSNRTYAKVGGLGVMELCRLEEHLLTKVRYEVFFRQEDLDHVTAQLAKASAAAPGSAASICAVAEALGLSPPQPHASTDEFRDVWDLSGGSHSRVRSPALLGSTPGDYLRTSLASRVHGSEAATPEPPPETEPLANNARGRAALARELHKPPTAGSGSAAARALRV